MIARLRQIDKPVKASVGSRSGADMMTDCLMVVKSVLEARGAAPQADRLRGGRPTAGQQDLVYQQSLSYAPCTIHSSANAICRSPSSHPPCVHGTMR